MKSCFYGTIIQKEWLSPTSCCDLDMHKVDPSFYIGRNKWNRPVTLRPSNIAPVSLMWINSPSPPEEKAGGIRWGVIWLGLWLPEPCPGRVRGSWCRPQCNKTWTAPGHHCSQPQSLHHTFTEMKLQDLQVYLRLPRNAASSLLMCCTFWSVKCVTALEFKYSPSEERQRR